MIHGNTMDLRPEMSIGERIAVARRYAGLTQEALAEQARVNVDTIRKLEQGQRQSARVSTITAIAHALGVTTIAILEGLPSEEEQEDPQLLALRRALLPVSEFVPGADHPEETTLPDITALQESVSDAWSTYHAGDMAALGRIVPRLLDEARVAVREHTNGQWHQANAILVKTYQLGAHVLARGRMEDLALHGLDRARSYAERADDPLLGAMLANSVSWIMMRTGRPDDSEVVAVSAADAIEPKFRSSSPAHISVYGGLRLPQGVIVVMTRAGSCCGSRKRQPPLWGIRPTGGPRCLVPPAWRCRPSSWRPQRANGAKRCNWPNVYH